MYYSIKLLCGSLTWSKFEQIAHANPQPTALTQHLAKKGLKVENNIFGDEPFFSPPQYLNVKCKKYIRAEVLTGQPCRFLASSAVGSRVSTARRRYVTSGLSLFDNLWDHI